MNNVPRRFLPSVERLEDRLVPSGKGGHGHGQMGQASFSAGLQFSASAQSSSSVIHSSSTTVTSSPSSSSSTTITVTLVNGVLTVKGSARADQIVVRTSQLMIQIMGTGITCRAGDVREIVICGRGGNDVIDLRGLKLGDGQHCSIFGNGGDDKVFGGACAEIIHGGAGDDTLCGNGGNDQMFGGAGKDWLEGRQGDDLLDGGKGCDILRGGIGADTLVSAIDRVVDQLHGGAGFDALVPNVIGGIFSFDLTDICKSLENKVPSNPPSQPPPSKAVSIDTIRADLAGRLGVSIADIHVVRVEEGYWPDTALGCPEPGMAYAQVLVRGRRVVLEANGVQYEYHTDDAFTGRFILCDSPMGTLYPL